MTDLAADSGRDVALYVHWPYCSRICPYCDFNVVRHRGRSDEQAALTEAIRVDLERQVELAGADRRLASIFFGGGTPSLMDPDEVGSIISLAHSLLPSAAELEVTLEANPTDAEADRFSALAAAGVNRLSMGVQALDDDSLRLLGRTHSAQEARRAVDLAARVYSRLSIDLIYARPGQSVADWKEELRAALVMGFEHISPYQLTIEAGTAFGRAVKRGAMKTTDEELAADLFDATQDILEEAGLPAYEVSNHARGTGARSSHNLHIWRGGDYMGLGPGAHGRVTLQGRRTATVAHRGVAAYVAGVRDGAPWAETETLSAREAGEERVLLGMRTVEGVDLQTLAALGLDRDAEPLVSLIEQGLLAVVGDRLAATRSGRPVLDAVLKAMLT